MPIVDVVLFTLPPLTHVAETSSCHVIVMIP